LKKKGDMGSSSYNAQPGDGAFRPTYDQGPPSWHGDQRSPSPESYRELLDEVLQQTLVSRDEETRQRLESLDGLLEIARRRHGEEFALDPIGIELVETVLRTPFRALLASEDQWHEMTGQIARTLCEDPVAYDRLNNLWRRLRERCGNGN
jgi:hypothetical protein